MEGLATGVGGALEAQDMVAPVFALTILGNGLLAATAVVQRLQLNADPNVLTTARKRSYSLLPYGAIAATYVLLLVVLQDGLDLRTWLVFGAAAASTSLVVVRQLAAFIENERLLGELDAKVTERDQLAAALHHLAFHDSLTGLANRVLFTDRLDADLARGRRAGTSTAVMLIDLDDFKPVNDHLGHRAGDDLLMEIACRLRACVRETDTVARLGGDEFAVLLEHPLDDGVRSVAARMVRVIGEPVIVNDGDVVSVGASVGVAVGWPGDGAAASLLNDADLAMYRAKKRGKGAYEISGNPARDRRYITPPGGLASDDEQLAGPVPSSNGKQPRRRRSDRVPTGALGEDSP
jgi:diguanylate cyclase (GGDEF)-like protein